MRPSRTVSIVAAAAAITLVLGVAGLAASRGGDEPLEKLSVGGGDYAVAGLRASARDEATSLIAPWPGSYVVDGRLPALADTAPALRYRSAADAKEAMAAVARVAKALGLDGPATREKGSWTVHDGDLTLVVQDGPGMSWFLAQGCFAVADDFGNETAVRDDASVSACAFGDGNVTGGSIKGGGGDTILPACPDVAGPPDCAPAKPDPVASEPVRPAGLPSRTQAEAAARAAFARLGVGVQGLRLDDGFALWYAAVPLRAGGFEAAGVQTSVAIGPGMRIIGGNGRVLAPSALGDYPLAGVDVGLERLKAGRFVGIIPLGAAEAESASDTTPPAGPPTGEPSAPDVGTLTPDCGAPTVICDPPVPPSGPDGEAKLVCPDPGPCQPVSAGPIHITGVHLALAMAGDTLVPAYVFETADGDTAPVPAVVEHLLADDTMDTGLMR